MAEVLATFLSQLQVLYYGEPHRKKEADKWLVEFSRKPHAWMVCDQTLMMGGEGATGAQPVPDSYLFFASHTMLSKLRFDFEQLPPESLPSLKSSLWNHLRRFRKGPTPVIRKLALCVCSLAIQMGEGATIVQEFINTFGPLGDALACIMEFLVLLPEEACDEQLDYKADMQKRFRDGIGVFAVNVLQFITQAMSNSGGDTELQRRVFFAFASWLKLGYVNGETIAACPLLGLAFDAFPRDELQEAASEAIVAAVRRSERVEEYLPVVQFVMPRILNLAPLLVKARQEEDYDLGKELSFIFCEAAEAYIGNIVGAAPDSPYLQLVQLVLNCASFPDGEVAGTTFNFWYLLAQGVSELGDGAREQQCAFFAPVYTSLVECLVNLAEFPRDQTAMSEASLKEFRNFRYGIQDSLHDCVRVLGIAPLLRQLFAALSKRCAEYEQSGGRVGWVSLEAALYCFRCISKVVPPSENEVIPKLLPLLPHLPQQPDVLYTATLVAGRYADWLAAHPEFLTYLFPFIINGLRLKEVAPAAALSFKQVCDCCAAHLVQHMDAVIKVHEDSLPFQLPLRDEVEVVEGVCHVMKRLHPQTMGPALARLCQPMLGKLKHLVMAAQQYRAQGQAPPKELISSVADTVGALGTAFRPLHTLAGVPAPNPVAEIFKAEWSLFEALYTVFGASETVIEKLSTLFKYAVKDSGAAWEPLLLPFLTVLAQHFAQYQYAAALYTATEAILTFGEQPQYQEMLFQWLSSVSSRVFLTLQDHSNFSKMPDLVEDYFDLVARYLRVMPYGLLQSPLFISVLQCGLAGLTMDQKAAVRSILYLFERMCRMAKPLEERPVGEAVVPATLNQPTALVPLVLRILDQLGPMICREIMLALAQRLTSSHAKYAAKVLKAMIDLAPTQTQQWLYQTLLASEFTAFADDAMKTRFMQALFGARTESGAVDAAKAFADSSRRYQKSLAALQQHS